MTQPDVLGVKTFLPDLYNERLRATEVLSEQIDPSVGSEDLVNQQLKSTALRMAVAVTESYKFIRKETKTRPYSSVDSAEGREKFFRIRAFAIAETDSRFQLALGLSSMLTGDQIANSPDNVEECYSIGESLVMQRARYAASAVLIAGDTMLVDYDGDNSSVMAKTMGLLRSGRAKSGPSIRDREYRRFDDLSARSMDQPVIELLRPGFTPSRFKFINIAKAIKLSSKAIDVSNDRDIMAVARGSLAMSREFLGGQLEPLELSPRDITDVLTIGTKIIRNVKNTAQVDKSLASDPVARYTAYILDKLSGSFAVNSEKMAFKRRAEQTAVRLTSE